MTEKIERRTLGAELRAEKTGENAYQIRGYAATFNSPSKDLGGFREIVAPGAFKRALKEKQDTKCLFNHSADKVMGRCGNGTLELKEDERGLLMRCQLNPAITWHRDLWESISRGDISEMSFAFKAPESGQKWTTKKDERGTYCQYRTLTDVDLFDVSAVTYPAYNTTSLEARSFDYTLVIPPNGEDVELAYRVAKVGKIVAADQAAVLEDARNILRAARLGDEVRADELRQEFRRFVVGTYIGDLTPEVEAVLKRHGWNGDEDELPENLLAILKAEGIA